MAAKVSLDHLFRMREGILTGNIFELKNENNIIVDGWTYSEEAIRNMQRKLIDLEHTKIKEQIEEGEESELLKRSEVSIAYRPLDIYPESDDVWCGKGWYLVNAFEGLDLCASGPFESYDKAEKEFYSLPE